MSYDTTRIVSMQMKTENHVANVRFGNVIVNDFHAALCIYN